MTHDIGHYAMLAERKARAVAINSPAVVRRILGQPPSYERAVSHCIVIDLKTGERTHERREPPPPPPPKPKPFTVTARQSFRMPWIDPGRFRGLAEREGVITFSNRLKVADIIVAVAKRAGIDPSQMIGPGRTFRVSRPRQVAMYITTQLRSDLSGNEIGHLFGSRDHSTVSHAIKKTKERLARPGDPNGDLCRAVMEELANARRPE
jgi:hypothetical protein